MTTGRTAKEAQAVTIRESAENYLETILILSKKSGGVRAVDIASEMDFTKPSVSVAMKKLREKGLITVDDDGHILLTDRGTAIAESVYERHVLLSDWLESIGVDRAVALEDACKLEHVLSPESFAAIKGQYLKLDED